MGKFEKNNETKTGKKKTGLLIAGIAVAAVVFAVVIAVFAGKGGETSQEPDPTVWTQAVADETQSAETEAAAFKVLTVDSIEEQGDTMVVTTSYGVVKYPFAFSDLIQIEAVNGADCAALEFSAVIGGETYPAFTVSFGGSDGTLVGSMVLEEAQEAVPVYVAFHEADAALEENGLSSFQAAQEIFNDIAVSLAENAGFTPAQ